MATEQIRCAMRLVPLDDAALDALESSERLVIRGSLSCFSYTSHDYASDKQETVSVELGRFTATLFLAATASARIYRYDNSLHSSQRAGAIAKIEFVAYDLTGKELLADTFIPGRDNDDENFVSHNEVWHTENGSNKGLHLQRFVSDQFVELLDEDLDMPLWEGKSISFCRDSFQDFSRQQVSYAAQKFLPPKKQWSTGKGYFSYTHDFKGSINEFHWVLMGLITDITPMLVSVSGAGV